MSALTALSAFKLHGARNTFVLIDERPARAGAYPALARRLCAPDGGMDGADGLLVLGEAPDAFARMQIYNADGSRPEMCGNGVRCVARYLHDRGSPDTFVLATDAGRIGVSVTGREPFEARVDMGPVTFPSGVDPQTVARSGGTLTYYETSVGNPHAVVFVDAVGAVDLPALGAAFERLERFPQGTNVHVVAIAREATIDVRHYERGVGETQACGTGAVASAAVANAVRGVRSPVTVNVPGGTLRVQWAPGEHAFLTGPAEPMFERSIEP